MTREYWYFVAGMLVVLLPLILLYAIKKFDLLEIRPDRKVVYSVVDGRELELHVFKARNAGAATPALLFFHGGRWLFGEPRGFYPQCKYFSEQGIACFSVQYRLGAQGRVDVRHAVRDARAALAYLHAHAGELGIDPGRIAAGGGSSGGHLAAVLGAIDTGAPRPAALVLYNPMLDLSPCTPDHHLVREYWQEISPLQHVDAAAPPSLILLGSDDPEVPLSTAQAYCDAMQTGGGRCELVIYDGQSHGFFNPKPGKREYFERTNAQVIEFLDTVWAAAPAPGSP